jgi:hypothetical protein
MAARHFLDVSMRKTKVSDGLFMQILFALLLVNAALLALWFGVDGVQYAPRFLEELSTVDAPVFAPECSESSFAFLEYGFVGFLLMGGLFVGWITRETSGAFRETKQISEAIMAMSFFSIVVVPLNYVVNDSFESALLLRSLGCSFASLTITGIVFGSKMYTLCWVSEDDAKTIAAASRTNTRTRTVDGKTRTQMGARGLTSRGEKSSGALGGGEGGTLAAITPADHKLTRVSEDGAQAAVSDRQGLVGEGAGDVSVDVSSANVVLKVYSSDGEAKMTVAEETAAAGAACATKRAAGSHAVIAADGLGLGLKLEWCAGSSSTSISLRAKIMITAGLLCAAGAAVAIGVVFVSQKNVKVATMQQQDVVVDNLYHLAVEEVRVSAAHVSQVFRMCACGDLMSFFFLSPSGSTGGERKRQSAADPQPVRPPPPPLGGSLNCACTVFFARKCGTMRHRGGTSVQASHWPSPGARLYSL